MRKSYKEQVKEKFWVEDKVFDLFRSLKTGENRYKVESFADEKAVLEIVEKADEEIAYAKKLLEGCFIVFAEQESRVNPDFIHHLAVFLEKMEPGPTPSEVKEMLKELKFDPDDGRRVR